MAAGPVEKDLSKPSVDGMPSIDATMASLSLWALTAFPASAADLPAGGPPASSYYVSLGLFVITVPGRGHQLNDSHAVAIFPTSTFPNILTGI